MFFDRRKKFNRKVAKLLGKSGLNLMGAGVISILNDVLDIAWRDKFNEYEGALLVVYVYSSGVAKSNYQAAEALSSLMLEIQNDWLSMNLIRPHIASKLKKIANNSISSANNDTSIEKIDYPISPDMPDVTKGETLKIYKSDGYLALLVKDSPSIAESVSGSPQPLKYPYAFVVIDAKNNTPKYFVTLEEGITGSTFLCVFGRQGLHLNLGSDPVWHSETNFLNKSIALVEKEFGIQLIPENNGSAPNKNDLIRSLAKKRISEDPLASSMGYDEGMIDSLDAMALSGIPEAAIVTIVETYSLSKEGGASDSEIFNHIEKHRSQSGSGLMPNPLNLESYIQYRIEIEHSHGAPVSKHFISEAVAICCKQYSC